ncbi:hypothetical protein ACEPAF_5951 [Sanghuangporus sanghuang]
MTGTEEDETTKNILECTKGKYQYRKADVMGRGTAMEISLAPEAPRAFIVHQQPPGGEVEFHEIARDASWISSFLGQTARGATRLLKIRFRRSERADLCDAPKGNLERADNG